MRKLGAVEELAAVNQVQRQLRLCHEFPFFCSMSYTFRHLFGAAGRAENADIEQMEKIIPLIACESVHCQYVCELVFGVNII